MSSQKNTNLASLIIKLCKTIKRLIIDGFLHIMTGNILTKIASFLTSIIIARFVDKASFAHLTYADNLYQYITYLSGFGLAGALLKYIKPGDSEGTNYLYVRFSLKVGLIFDTILVTLLIVVAFLTETPFPEARTYILLLAAVPLLSLIISNYGSYLRATFQNVKFARIGVFNASLVLLLCLPFAYYLGAKGVIVARYFASLIIVAIAVRELVKLKKRSRQHIIIKKPMKDFLHMGASLMVSTLLSNAIHLNEVFYINTFIRDPVITANYRVASLIPAQIGIISYSIVVYYFSIIANLTNYSKILRKVRETQVVALITILPIGIVGILLSPWMIRTFFGNHYSDAINISYAVWAIRLCNTLVRSIPMQLLPAIGRVNFSVIVNAVSITVHFILSYFFIKDFGVYGIIYSALITYLLSGIAYWVYLVHICKPKGVFKH